jgi:DNA-binding GntR family transcriptional regulator
MAAAIARRRRQAPQPGAPTDSRTRTAAIVAALENDILSGLQKPGDHLNEPDLADRFGVSRTPIREAMRHLAASGLVEISPRRGAFVARISTRTLLELFELMTEIEVLCASLAAKRARPDQREAMINLHRAYQALTQKPEDAEAYFDESTGFHRLVYAATQNSALEALANQTYARLLPYRRRQLSTLRRPEVSFAEHQDVLDAILAGDEAAAADAMRRHSGMVSGNVFDVLSSLLDEAPGG